MESARITPQEIDASGSTGMPWTIESEAHAPRECRRFLEDGLTADQS